MKKILTMILAGSLIYPLMALAEDWEDDLRNIDTNTSNTNTNVVKVLRQLEDDAAARVADDKKAKEDAAKALDGVSDAEKSAIAKAEKDRKAAEKNAKDNPYVIEVPAGTVMPEDAMTAYQADMTTAKKTHDDTRVTNLSTAKTNAASRITTKSQAMKDRADAREALYKARIKNKPLSRPAPKFYN